MSLTSHAAAAFAAAIVTLFVSLPADARVKKDYRYEERSGEQLGWAQSQQRYAAPLSLDGRNTGRARTCGSETFVYDHRGVPTGPYCH